MLKPLLSFLPPNTLPVLEHILSNENYHLVITRPRTSKLGDFRPPRPGQIPKLTVNGNLNQYAFLITLVHEIAHLKIWVKYQNTVPPHGSEWKKCYSYFLRMFLGQGFFPSTLEKALAAHCNQPQYTTGSDLELSRLLKSYDAKDSNAILLETLPAGTKFLLQGRVFVLGNKMRKHFLCEEVQSGKKFRVHALAEVELITKSA